MDVAELILPRSTAPGELDLGKDGVADQLEELRLVGDVPVKGHRRDAEIIGEPPQ